MNDKNSALNAVLKWEPLHISGGFSQTAREYVTVNGDLYFFLKVWFVFFVFFSIGYWIASHKKQLGIKL